MLQSHESLRSHKLILLPICMTLRTLLVYEHLNRKINLQVQKPSLLIHSCLFQRFLPLNSWGFYFFPSLVYLSPFHLLPLRSLFIQCTVSKDTRGDCVHSCTLIGFLKVKATQSNCAPKEKNTQELGNL